MTQTRNHQVSDARRRARSARRPLTNPAPQASPRVATGASKPPLPSSAPLPPLRVLDVDGRRLAYRHYTPAAVLGAVRNKPEFAHLPADPYPAGPVLGIHGFGGDHLTFNRMCPALAACGHDVYALDLPAHGASSVEVRSGRLEEFVQVVTGFLDAVGEREVALIGHSMGGLIAMGCAVAHPERVTGVGLIAAAGLNPDADPDYLLAFLHASSRDALAEVMPRLSANTKPVSDTIIDYVWAWKSKPGVDAALTTIANNVFTDGDARSATAPALVLPAADLAAHGVPTLVIWGEDDTVIDLPGTDSLPAHAETLIFPGVGHSPHLESVDELNWALADFLATLPVPV